ELPFEYRNMYLPGVAVCLLFVGMTGILYYSVLEKNPYIEHLEEFFGIYSFLDVLFLFGLLVFMSEPVTYVTHKQSEKVTPMDDTNNNSMPIKGAADVPEESGPPIVKQAFGEETQQAVDKLQFNPATDNEKVDNSPYPLAP